MWQTFGDNTVSVIDISLNKAMVTIPVGEAPMEVEVIPDGTKVYVTHKYGTVSVIDISINKVTATLNVGFSPSGIAASPEGTKVIVTNEESDTVSVINTTTNKVMAAVNVGNGQRDITFGEFTVRPIK